MSLRGIDTHRSASLIVRKLLAVKPGEQVTIVCDPHTEMEMAYALVGQVECMDAEYTIVIQPTRSVARKNELTPVAEAALEKTDVLIALTGSGGAPSYASSVMRLYKEKRLRLMSMVMRTLENFVEGGARADYDALLADGNQLGAIWKTAHHIRLQTAKGTDLTTPVYGERVTIECGFATEPGTCAAFSDGEVSQMPQANQAEGRLVIDGPIAHLGQPDSPITLEIHRGRVVNVLGDCRQAEELRGIIQTVDNADNFAEIGIGLNDACRRNGDFEEEKKARGNVHIAIGDNIYYGGDVESMVHMDMVIYQPTVTFDEQVIVDAGVIRLGANL